MGIRYRIDGERGVIFTEAFGEVTNEEYLAHPVRLLNDPALPRPYLELYDTRRLESTDLKTEDIRRMTLGNPRVVEAMQGARVAVVAESDLSYGLGRIFQTFAEKAGFQVWVTKDYREALRFLNQDPENTDS